MNHTCGCSPDCTVERGTCHCGCGQKTRIAPQSSTERGWVKGEPIAYVKGHAPRTRDHRLSNIDWQHREATCFICGRVTFKSNGSGGLRCTRTLNTQHRISEVDEIAETGYCRACRERVRIHRRSHGRGWECATKRSEVDRAYRESIPIEERREAHRAWREANREHIRAYHRRTRYGLTEGESETLFLFQGGRCAICWREPSGRRGNAVLHLDHSHASLANRGLLCADCNRMLGLAEDDASRLRAAADYLDAHR